MANIYKLCGVRNIVNNLKNVSKIMSAVTILYFSFNRDIFKVYIPLIFLVFYFVAKVDHILSIFCQF